MTEENNLNLELKLENLQELIEAYKTLPDANKLGKGNEITKLIKECDTQLEDYNQMIQILSNDNHNEEMITQEEYLELIEEINIAQQLIKSAPNLDTMMQIYAEMSNNINKCEKFLSSKQMIVNVV